MPVSQPRKSGWLLGGRYRVIDRIGSGGMAEVFRAHDALLGRDVAVKVFRTHVDPSDSSAGKQRQEVELQTLARLGHPNLITLFDGSVNGTSEPAYLVMELIDGPSLSARLADGPLPEPEARQVAIQVADALAYVHGRGMVHRDVKPANILLGTDTTTGDTTVRARLSDFGIVRLMGSERLTSVDFMVGTASYLAPEQARGVDVGPSADVYALGLVLIETLSGVRAFDGPPLEAVMARLARSPEIPPDLPQPWPELLSAMTASDETVRPSAAEVASILRGGRFSAVQPPVAERPGALGGFGPAAVGVSAASGTAMMPVVEAGSGPPRAGLGPVGFDEGDRAGRTGRAGWLLAVTMLIAALAVGGYLLLRTTHGSNTPTTTPTTTPPAASQPATTQNTGPTQVSTEVTSQPPTSATPSASPTRSTAPPSSSAARSSSAPPTTSAVPSSSTGPSGTSSNTAPAPNTATSSPIGSSAGTPIGQPVVTASPTAAISTPAGARARG